MSYGPLQENLTRFRAQGVAFYRSNLRVAGKRSFEMYSLVFYIF